MNSIHSVVHKMSSVMDFEGDDDSGFHWLQMACCRWWQNSHQMLLLEIPWNHVTGCIVREQQTILLIACYSAIVYATRNCWTMLLIRLLLLVVLRILVERGLPPMAGGRFWCAACYSDNRTCSTSTLLFDCRSLLSQVILSPPNYLRNDTCTL